MNLNIKLLIFFCSLFSFLVLYGYRVGAESQSNYILDARFGHGGKGAGEFSVPHSIVFDSLGNMYVTDNSNNRVQKFTSNGTFITKWGSHGKGDGQFLGPEGIDVDSGGNIYVADTGNSRIQKFTSNGTFITKWGSHGKGDGQFSSHAHGVLILSLIHI